MFSQKRQFGNIGEEIATMFLVKHNFQTLERNYLKKWGEIDVVARKGDRLHFIEVKTVVANPDGYIRGEEQVHEKKLERLSRTIESYLLEKNISSKTSYQLDLVVVEINKETKKAKVRYLPNIG